MTDRKTNPRKSFTGTLREASQFYMAQGNVYDTLRRLARRLDAEKIPYALIGGMALAAHGFVRMTQDVDILVTAKGLAAFRERCVGRGYVPAFSGAERSFRDTETQVRIEIITTGEYPGDGKPKPVVFPDPASSSIEREGMRVVTLEKLIELKLASGMTATHRLRDLADVQDVIAALDLPEDFAERLDASVRGKYRELRVTAQNRKQADE
ncbi:MAG: hypothetical protein KGJ80_19295 [Chloroflexota bacterium]|nr:hypothetical protein [Chloroflexota bacterium]